MSPAPVAASTLSAAKAGASVLADSLREVNATSADLLDLLHAAQSSNEREYVALDVPIFSRRPAVVFPPALLDQYSQLQYKCFMGLLPAINRAYLTIDNKLFLWNYANGKDICEFSGVDEIIVSVGLVKPRPDVFVDEIKYLLVIATPLEIVLLGVCFQGGSPSGTLVLYPTQLSMPSDKIDMLRIVGTDNGRILMGGKDGNVYEIIYQSQEGWFSKRCKKVNVSKGRLSMLVPHFFRSSVDPIVDIVVDEQRHILYTLSLPMTIQVFYLGERGDSISMVAQWNSLARDGKTCTPQYSEWIVQAKSIVHLAPVSPSESSKITLVGITNNGLRLFFTVFSDVNPYTLQNGGGRSTPSSLQLIAVRLPPDPPSAGGSALLQQARAPTSYHVHLAHYHNGTMLLADSRTEDLDSLVGTVPDTAFFNNAQAYSSYAYGSTRKPLRECVAGLEIEGKIWAFAETPSPGGSSLCGELLPNQPQSAREFLCLTTTGVHRVTKSRAVDQLRDLLKANESEAVKKFFERFGESLSCAMCLQLACEAQSDLVSVASQVFFEYGGAPSFETRAETVPAAGTGDMGRAITTPQLRHSGCYRGLNISFACVVLPFWSNSIFSAMPGGTYKCRFTSEQLQRLHTSVGQLLGFLTRNPQFLKASASTGDTNETKTLWKRMISLQKRPQNEPAMKAEQKCLGDVQVTLQRTAHAAFLLAFLNDHMLSRLLERLPPEMQQRCLSTTFSQLVSSEDGAAVARTLVSCLLDQYSQDRSTIRHLSEALSENCGSFFSWAEATLSTGKDLLSKARTVTSPSERAALYTEAIQVYLQIAQQPDGNILDAVSELGKVGFCRGAIDILLARLTVLHSSAATNEIKPDDLKAAKSSCIQAGLALAAQLNATHPAESVVTSEVGRAIILSNIRDLHYAFYDWLYDTRKEELQSVHSAFIEAYLLDRDVRLLAEHFKRSERFSEAANLLANLADKADPGLPLRSRIELLSQAIVSARASSVAPEVLSDLEEKLQVAQAQLEVLQELESVGGDEGRPAVTQLNSRLLTVTELFNGYAQKYGLWRSALVLIETAEHDDPPVCQQCWSRVFESQGLSAATKSLSGLSARTVPAEDVILSAMKKAVQTPGAGPTGIKEFVSAILRIHPVPVVVDVLKRVASEVTSSHAGGRVLEEALSALDSSSASDLRAQLRVTRFSNL